MRRGKNDRYESGSLGGVSLPLLDGTVLRESNEESCLGGSLVLNWLDHGLCREVRSFAATSIPADDPEAMSLPGVVRHLPPIGNHRAVANLHNYSRGFVI